MRAAVGKVQQVYRQTSRKSFKPSTPGVTADVLRVVASMYSVYRQHCELLSSFVPTHYNIVMVISGGKCCKGVFSRATMPRGLSALSAVSGGQWSSFSPCLPGHQRRFDVVLARVRSGQLQVVVVLPPAAAVASAVLLLMLL